MKKSQENVYVNEYLLVKSYFVISMLRKINDKKAKNMWHLLHVFSHLVKTHKLHLAETGSEEQFLCLKETFAFRMYLEVGGRGAEGEEGKRGGGEGRGEEEEGEAEWL